MGRIVWWVYSTGLILSKEGVKSEHTDSDDWEKEGVRTDAASALGVATCKCTAFSWKVWDLNEAMPERENFSSPNASHPLRSQRSTNVPLIHFIDLYLTFKFCPLTITVLFLLNMRGVAIYIQGCSTASVREMIAIINAHWFNTQYKDVQIEKKDHYKIHVYWWGNNDFT